MNIINKIYLINKKEFIERSKYTNEGILVFEKRNYKIHDRLYKILDNMVAWDLINIINEYTNEQYVINYRLDCISEDYIYICLYTSRYANNNLNFGYRIEICDNNVHINTRKVQSKSFKKIIAVKLKLINNTYNCKHIPLIQTNLANTFFNDYMYYYYGNFDYLNNQDMHSKPSEYLLKKENQQMYYIICTVIDHKKLKCVIIMLRMIIDILRNKALKK